MSEMRYPPLVVMGVQGTGKSTIGEALALRLGVKFIDSDSLHPQANRDKMASGTPLEDEDRLPWLKVIGQTLHEHQERGEMVIIACSALKRWYRELLRHYAPEVEFLHLEGSKSIVGERIAHRNHEYMPTTLLDSQFATLEPLAGWEAGIGLDIEASPTALVDKIINYLESPLA